MFRRKLIAVTMLATGLAGSAAATTDLTTIIGSTSTAGAPTVCVKKAVCGSTPTKMLPTTPPPVVVGSNG